ncbi:unnamed protein product [Chondrus crispus]|uniref:Uncharacterized protein n=1 Tax=Chondrus crispus TaxID=2769 RepID=R7Q576_CHOCR|nr:unnamed protein product [Chondrus crispus]XP_005712982.1 unnamed protein product [Chondrus crispus]CDF33179.1 unnamed protein product [Chondrus crispus]CDF41137.1 unnamed protein product [Chondrus crispus]|eukprot:XP_005711431.1 unnamed protein product [Chondrus crispus]
MFLILPSPQPCFCSHCSMPIGISRPAPPRYHSPQPVVMANPQMWR